MCADTVIKVPAAHLNLSPYGFMHWARHFLKCRHDFVSPDQFSPVPHFLVCRAIELGLKARHLETLRQKDVKDQFGHNLLRALDALPPGVVTLSDRQRQVLEAANDIYKGKGFEYFSVIHAVTGFTAFPNLETLDAIAALVVTHEG